jgi:hypothetical protein
LGVTTVAAGSRFVFNTETASGASRVRLRGTGRHQNGIDDELQPGNTADPVGDHPHDIRGGEHAGFYCRNFDVVCNGIDLCLDKFRREGDHVTDAIGILCGDGRQRGNTVNAKGGKCLQVGLDAGTRNGIAARDGERRPHG